MRPITDEKLEKVVSFLDENKIDVLFIFDYENMKDINMQYLSGHPMDALVMVTRKGELFLSPWDVPLAEKYAEVDEIFNIYEYESSAAFYKFLMKEKFKKLRLTIGLNSNIPLSSYLQFKRMKPFVKVYNHPEKINRLLTELRTTKSAAELDLLKGAAEIGNKTILEIEKFAQNATDETEVDLDLKIRQTMLNLGAEDVAFPTLVGSTPRAHNLHCHPAASNAKFAVPGLAVVDFGARYKGYNSDITVPISFGELSEEQQKMRDLTQQAYDAALETLDIGVPLWQVHEAAVKVIKDGGYSMPHALGHGLGLTEHDAPILAGKPKDPKALKRWKEVKAENGMVFTIEPGVYKEGLGGQRLENDVILWNDKVEVITKSRFITV